MANILRTGKFWCSRFWEMNDPMEGIYRLTDNCHGLKELFDKKARRLICSFSNQDAVKNPVMWGYYANGFKGVAIEIEVTGGAVKPLNYTPDLVCPNRTDPIETSVEKILCNKLTEWKHECESRFITTGGDHLRKVGKITGVCLGLPYRNAMNHDDVDARWEKLRKYHDYVEKVIAIARELKLEIREASMRNGKVQLTAVG